MELKKKWIEWKKKKKNEKEKVSVNKETLYVFVC